MPLAVYEPPPNIHVTVADGNEHSFAFSFTSLQESLIKFALNLDGNLTIVTLAPMLQAPTMGPTPPIVQLGSSFH